MGDKNSVIIKIKWVVIALKLCLEEKKKRQNAKRFFSFQKKKYGKFKITFFPSNFWRTKQNFKSNG